MAFSYDLTHIENWQELLSSNSNEPGFVIPFTEVLIWATLLIGIPQITEKNVDEFAFRLRLYETIANSLIQHSGISSPIPFSQVKRHIGLATNANSLTRAQYIRNVIYPSLMEKLEANP